jgi:adenylyltransferase/sulfurtransferase
MKDIINIKYWGDEVFPLLSWFDAEKVKNAKVMVVGAGALGNEVLKNLALFGIGTIVIIDFDHIEKSNLCRSVLFRMEDAENSRSKAETAARRIKEINSTINVKYINGDIGSEVGLGLIREMDVVIGCLDNRLARYLINRQCFRVDRPWIDGGIENLEGNVRIFKQGVNCYECSLSDTEIEQLQFRTGCPDIAKFNVVQGRVATTPISASIVGAIQTQEALKIIHDYTDQTESPPVKTLVGRMFKYDGMTLSTGNYKMQYYEDDCLSHEMWLPVIEAKNLNANMKVSEALKELARILKTDEFSINLMNNRFVYQLVPEFSEKEIDVMLPESKVAAYIEEHDVKQNPLERVFQNYYEEIDKEFPFQDMTLQQIGIPAFDILKISTPDSVKYVELTGDKKDWV